MVQTKRGLKPTTTITVSTPEGASKFAADFNVLATRLGKRMSEITRTALDNTYGNDLAQIAQERQYAEVRRIVAGTDLEAALLALPTAALMAELDMSALEKATDQIAYVRGLIQRAKRNARGN